MKLSVSNIAWTSDNDEEMYEFLYSNGFHGLEIAPTRIFPVLPYEHIQEARIFEKQLKERYNLSISSIQSIWYGINENIFDSDEARKSLYDYTVKAINFGNALKCTNIVFGCPKNRNISVNRDAMDEKAAHDFFYRIGDYAAQQGVVIAIEPNPIIYGTNFINTTAEAVAFAKAVDCPGLLVNLDLGTVIHNNEDLSSITGYLPLINHIHISEPGLENIKARTLHKELSDILNLGDYSGFVSIEMKNSDNILMVMQTIAYVRRVFG